MSAVSPATRTAWKTLRELPGNRRREDQERKGWLVAGSLDTAQAWRGIHELTPRCRWQSNPEAVNSSAITQRCRTPALAKLRLGLRSGRRRWTCGRPGDRMAMHDESILVLSALTEMSPRAVSNAYNVSQPW